MVIITLFFIVEDLRPEFVNLVINFVSLKYKSESFDNENCEPMKSTIEF